MKKTFIFAMFLFWGFVVAIISAGYVLKQNRIAQEVLQKAYQAKIDQIKTTTGSVSTPSSSQETVVTDPTSPIVDTQTPPTTTTPKPTPTPVPTPTPAPKPIVTPSGPTVATVAQHSTQGDCWIIVNGNVYSVASYIPMHPGGSQRIVSECGGDATSVFDGIKRGRGHSSYANSLLGQYLVGALQ